MSINVSAIPDRETFIASMRHKAGLSLDDCEDLYQDVCVKFIWVVQRGYDVQNATALTMTMGRNLLIDESRRRTLPLEQPERFDPASKGDWLAELIECESLRLAMAQLPNQLWEVLKQHRLEELSLEQVGINLGISPATVCRRFAKAKSALLAILHRSGDLSDGERAWIERRSGVQHFGDGRTAEKLTPRSRSSRKAGSFDMAFAA